MLNVMKKIVLIFLFGCYITYSQNVVIDNSFGTNGSVLTENTTGMSKTIIIEDDKFISVGSKTITTTPYVHTAVLAKYNSDGSLDSAFGSNGIVNTIIEYRNGCGGILLQSDNKILVAGEYYATTPDGPGGRYGYLARYGSNGDLDVSFGDNGIKKINFLNNGASCSLSAIAILPNNQILASIGVGSGYPYRGLAVKFNADGSLDTTYGTNGLVPIYNTPTFRFTIFQLILTSDSKILLCGNDTSIYNNPKFTVVRLNLDGTFDTTFGDNGKVILDLDPTLLDGTVITSEYASKMIELTDSKILIKGGVPNGDHVLIELNTDGSLVSTFGTNGILIDNYVFYDYLSRNDLAVQNNGKILLCGTNTSSTNPILNVVRLNQDGSLDTTFNSTGFFDLAVTNSIENNLSNINFQSDGNLIVSGSSLLNNNYVFYHTRLLIDDTLGIIGNNLGNDNFKVYPNPFTNNINITSNSVNVISRIKICDTTGRLVKEIANINTNTVFTELNLASGIYYCRIIYENGNQFTQKIVRE